MMQLSIVPQEHRIEVPGIARPRPALAQLGRDISFVAADALVATDNALLGEDQLDVAQAQAEQVTEPHSVLDDLGWEAAPWRATGPGRYPPAWLSQFVPTKSRERDNIALIQEYRITRIM
jgi:hypothetical protein